MYSLYCSLDEPGGTQDSGRNSSQPSHPTPLQPPVTASPEPDPALTPNTGGQQSRRSRPFQPFILDESIRSLAGHESWWVTWAAVHPGVYFGM